MVDRILSHGKSNMKNALIKFTLALILLLVVAPLGCANDPAVKHIQHQGTIAVAKATTQGALKLQTTKDANAVNKENGTNAPATHPIAATNNTVAELHGVLVILTIVSFVAYAVLFGLSFSSYKEAVTPFVPPVRMVAVLFAVALFTLPFMPIAIFAVIGAAVGLFIYELIRAKGNVKLAIEDEESDLGLTTSSPALVGTAAMAGSTTLQKTVSSVTNAVTAAAHVEAHTVGEKA